MKKLYYIIAIILMWSVTSYAWDATKMFVISDSIGVKPAYATSVFGLLAATPPTGITTIVPDDKSATIAELAASGGHAGLSIPSWLGSGCDYVGAENAYFYKLNCADLYNAGYVLICGLGYNSMKDLYSNSETYDLVHMNYPDDLKSAVDKMIRLIQYHKSVGRIVIVSSSYPKSIASGGEVGNGSFDATCSACANEGACIACANKNEPYFWAQVKAYCTANNITYIDFYNYVPSTWGNDNTSDGLHPTVAGSAEWYAFIISQITRYGLPVRTTCGGW